VKLGYTNKLNWIELNSALFVSVLLGNKYLHVYKYPTCSAVNVLCLLRSPRGAQRGTLQPCSWLVVAGYPALLIGDWEGEILLPVGSAWWADITHNPSFSDSADVVFAVKESCVEYTRCFFSWGHFTFSLKDSKGIYVFFKFVIRSLGVLSCKNLNLTFWWIETPWAYFS